MSSHIKADKISNPFFTSLFCVNGLNDEIKAPLCVGDPTHTIQGITLFL